MKEEKLEEANTVFAGTGVNVTTEGRKYLGGFVGTREGAIQYVNELQEEWLEQLQVLTEVAKAEPQSAYASFTSGFRHKVTYFMRTIPDLEEVLVPLDKFIDEQFIPAITDGHVLSKDDRSLLSLPVRLGGLGIPIFSKSCSKEFEYSLKATSTLRQNIVAQDPVYVHNKREENRIEAEIKNERKKMDEDLLKDPRSRMSQDKLRGNDLAQMKGASAWLTSLPLKDEGYVLTKREFFDALCLRYRWNLKRLPINCGGCGKKFNVDHALQCPNGGFIHRRHDQMRDLFAGLLNEVCYGVQTEPQLEPISGEVLPPSSNLQDEARLDIVALGFWQKYEKALFDVKVFNPFAQSYFRQNLESVFRQNEKQKKTAYNPRVIQIEHATFSPIVMSAMGGFGKETEKFVSRLIHLQAEKRGIIPSVTANYIRTKISFQLIRSQVACIRGSRSIKSVPIDSAEMELCTNAATIKE